MQAPARGPRRANHGWRRCTWSAARVSCMGRGVWVRGLEGRARATDRVRGTARTNAKEPGEAIPGLLREPRSSARIGSDRIRGGLDRRSVRRTARGPTARTHRRSRSPWRAARRAGWCGSRWSWDASPRSLSEKVLAAASPSTPMRRQPRRSVLSDPTGSPAPSRLRLPQLAADGFASRRDFLGQAPGGCWARSSPSGRRF